MESDLFETTLSWARKEGLFLHEHLERKCKDGVWGMYATQDIDKNTVLASFPLENLIQTEDNYPLNTSTSAKHIHSAAKAYSNKDNSKYANFFNFFDSSEYLKKYSTFYITEKEKNVIKEASPMLLREIITQNYLNTSLIDALHQYDASISKETYTLITLNYNSRAIGSSGFVPILESFNHASGKGEFVHEDKRVIIKSRVSYTKGEEVYTSYGALDVYTHAINYNYYAPGDDHYIQFHKRFLFPLFTQNDKKIAQELSRSYKVAVQEMNSLKVFSVEDKHAYLDEEKPSAKTIEIIEKLALQNDKYAYLLAHLNRILSSNHVSRFSEKYFPSRLKRFYWVLVKEKDIILKNIETVSKHMH